MYLYILILFALLLLLSAFFSSSETAFLNLKHYNKKIPNGETWHKPPYYIVNLPIATKDINENFDLENFIKNLVNKNNIRFYPNSVYSCNEWDSND